MFVTALMKALSLWSMMLQVESSDCVLIKLEGEILFVAYGLGDQILPEEIGVEREQLVEEMVILMNMVLSLMYSWSFDTSLARGQKSGRPDAMFISEMGRRNDEELGSGRNASIICSFDSESD